jgi:periplasmic protein TonB
MYEQNRAFHYAVLASIVLHGMLLFGVSQRDRPPRLINEPAIPLTARIVEPPASPAASPDREEPVPAPVAKPRPRAKLPAPKPVAKAPQPVAEPEVAAEPPMEEEAKAEAPVAPPAVTAKVDPAPAAAVPPAPAQAAPEIGTLAQYRLQLITAARNFKRYPRPALDNNWEGDVVVRMAMGANGRLAALTIQSSSGYAVLDQQALEMFRKASSVVQVPPALRGKEFALELRAIYSLKYQEAG